jgi:1-acyl-sn-glycerol-3-phosphate acyltransferase
MHERAEAKLASVRGEPSRQIQVAARSDASALRMYALGRVISRVILRLFFRLTITSRERIPASGPLVVVANHESLLDAFVVAAVLKDRYVTFLSAPWLYSVPVVGWVLRSIGALPAYTEGSDVSTPREAIRVLEKGGTVVVFPEGGISRNQLYGGAVFFAGKAGAPLVPLRITGTKKALPLGRWWPSLYTRIGVSVGEPIAGAQLCPPGTPTKVAVAQGRELLTELLQAVEQ